MNNKILYQVGDYDIIMVGHQPQVFRRNQPNQPLYPQAMQQINYSGANPQAQTDQPPAPPPASGSMNWEKLGMSVLICLGAIALLKYLPDLSPTANTSTIDPVAVREIQSQNKMLHQHVRNLESQLLLQSGRLSCP